MNQAQNTCKTPTNTHKEHKNARAHNTRTMLETRAQTLQKKTEGHKNAQICTKVHGNAQKFTEMRQKCTKMYKNVQKCTKMHKNAQKRTKMR